MRNNVTLQRKNDPLNTLFGETVTLHAVVWDELVISWKYDAVM